MILQRRALRGCVAVLVITAYGAFFETGVRGQAGAAADRAILEALYDATGGASWTNSANWKTAAPLGEWHGVTTDADGHVTNLNLTSNGLTGPIPDVLGGLANLQWLILTDNGLTGPIPDALGGLENLEALDLSVNSLTGSIPDALGGLEKLHSLYLSVNSLTGSIPATLGGLENLQYLSLDSNDFSGPIPDGLGSLANLRRLSLSSNDLSGPIPDALGSLTYLQRLSLGRTDLSGPIPDALGRLAYLEDLSLTFAWGVSGPLPPSLRSAASLAELDIFSTQACAPVAWSDWLRTIDFQGRLCGAETATIDVAVVHTPAALEASGGADGIAAVIDLMIAETNQAYETSGVRHRLALVGRFEVQYVESGSTATDVVRLGNPSDGHLDEAHALRDRVGADLVHLIVDGNQVDVGGRAIYPGAFAVTAHSGGGRTFAHELGHNMGLRHDRYQVHRQVEERQGPWAGWAAGGAVRADPAYGYVNQPALVPGTAQSRRWRTIMAYRTQCSDAGISCAQLLRFSNPRQRYEDDPLGVSFGADVLGAMGPADAAAVLDVTGPAVARWRDPPAGANRPPITVGELPDRTLPLPGVLTVDVSRTFSDPDGDPLAWSVLSSAPGVVAVAVAGSRLMLTAVSLGTAQIRVTATDPDGLSAARSFTVVVTDRPPISFTDDPIQPGVTPVRAIHFTELRNRVDGLRRAAGLVPFGWTDPGLRAGATPVRLVHLLELRQALGAAYQAMGRTPPRWTDAVPAAGATPIRAAHLTELRAAVVALE